MLQPVQRSLIVALGPLAIRAAEYAYDLIKAREGPTPAIDIVNLPEVITSRDELKQSDHVLQKSLVEISLTTHAPTLMALGYVVEPVPEIAVYLLAGMCPDCGRQVAMIAEHLQDVVHDVLGVQVAMMLIWITLDPQPELATRNMEQLFPHIRHFLKGILLLSAVNEGGLRLPDNESLFSRCGDLLWLLIATPMQRLPEWLSLGMNDPPLLTMGLSRWHWDKSLVRQLLTQRWLLNIVNLWLSPARGAVSDATLSRWLTRQRLQLEHLREANEHEWRADAGAFPGTLWVAPRPWHIRRLLADAAWADRQDYITCEDRQREQAHHLEPVLQQAFRAVAVEVASYLEGQPVGGISGCTQFLLALRDTVEELRRELLGELSKLEVHSELVAGQLQSTERMLESELGYWPAGKLRAWFRVVLTPWRWPTMFWHYRQLQRGGRRLYQFYRQRAVLRCQYGQAMALVNLLSSLDQFIKQQVGRVEELGDMLAFLQSNIAAWPRADDTSPELARFVTQFFSEFVEEMTTEAEHAAIACGGLQSILGQLDDESVQLGLENWVGERLTSLENVSAYEIVQKMYAGEKQLALWWQTQWSDATPLWRHDPTQLIGQHQQQTGVKAFLYGNGFSESEVRSYLPTNEIRILESREKENLFFLRIRATTFSSSLTSEAMT